MTNRFRVAGALAKRLEELGVPPDAVLRRAGLPTGLFEQSKILVTTEEMFGLYGAIHEVSGDPAIGLKLGSEERLERYSPTAIAALYSRSFRDALERIARYKRLTCPEEIRIVEGRKECAVEFVWLLAEKAEPPSLIDTCFAWVVTIGRRGTGRNLTPLRVELTRPEGSARLYEKYFGCAVKFGARHNKLLFRSEDIAEPFLTHNPDVLELVAPQLEAELRQQLADKLAGAGEGNIEEISGRSEAAARGCCARVARGGEDAATAFAGGAADVSEPGGRSAPGDGAALPARVLARIEPDGVSAGVRRPELVHPGVSPVGGNVSGRVAFRAVYQRFLRTALGGEMRMNI